MEEFLTMQVTIEGCQDERFARELAGTHGLWEDLSEYIRMPGICGFFTGAADACCFLLCVLTTALLLLVRDNLEASHLW